MHRDPLCARLDTTVAEAFRMLTEGPVHHLPVVDRTGRLVGMLSEHDLLRYMPPPATDPLTMAAFARFARRRVADLMVEAVLTATEDDLLEDAAEIMVGEHVPALAVVDDDGRPVGVLTLAEVAGALASPTPGR
jgi:acetoin utilization protein AcuB